MDFSFKPKLSKELVLEKYTEELLMEFYLGIPVTDLLVVSPLRQDRLPTCSFYRDKRNTLIFKDFATGLHLDVFGVVAFRYKCSYPHALKIIANDLGLCSYPELTKTLGKINTNAVTLEEKNTAFIQVQTLDFSKQELLWWNSFGVSKDILKMYDVYSCKYVFLNKQVVAKSKPSCPIYGYYGGKSKGYELWRCYFPTRETHRFMSNWSSIKLQGLSLLSSSGNVLVITKSLKDVMCLRSFGIEAIAPNSENVFVSKTTLSSLKERFKHIVVLFDNDRPGLASMIKIRKDFPDLSYVFIPYSYKSKDISDFYKRYGREQTENLFNSCLSWLEIDR